MTLQSLVLCAVAAGTVCMAPYAGAQTVERTAPLAIVEDGLGGFNAHFGDTFAATASGGTFTDIFTFSVDTPFDAAASLTSSYLNSPQTKDLAITALSLYRYDPASGDVLGTALAGIDQSGFGAHPTDAWSLTGFDLPRGAYAIRVDGGIDGVGGGAFGADLAISPVPEAQAWGMLAAGLGVLTTLARQRRALPAVRKVRKA